MSNFAFKPAQNNCSHCCRYRGHKPTGAVLVTCILPVVCLALIVHLPDNRWPSPSGAMLLSNWCFTHFNLVAAVFNNPLPPRLPRLLISLCPHTLSTFHLRSLSSLPPPFPPHPNLSSKFYPSFICSVSEDDQSVMPSHQPPPPRLQSEPHPFALETPAPATHFHVLR